jgi:hypothetical protein
LAVTPDELRRSERSKLRLPEDLARVDALLDDPAFFAPFARYFHPVLGRPSTPVEWYLRLMFLKFRHGPPPRARARRSSTAAASTAWSNGAPAQRAGSATSNAATDGTAPAWTAGTERRSGAGTGYSPTTSSRSRPWPDNRPRPNCPRTPPSQPLRPDLSLETFQVEVISQVHFPGCDRAGPESSSGGGCGQ